MDRLGNVVSYQHVQGFFVILLDWLVSHSPLVFLVSIHWFLFLFERRLPSSLDKRNSYILPYLDRILKSVGSWDPNYIFSNYVFTMHPNAFIVVVSLLTVHRCVQEQVNILIFLSEKRYFYTPCCYDV
jgi:hypothetical protein